MHTTYITCIYQCTSICMQYTSVDFNAHTCTYEIHTTKHWMITTSSMCRNQESANGYSSYIYIYIYIYMQVPRMSD